MPERRVVIAGAGMGGLAAAVALAANGFRTTVIEATDRPGGKARAIPVAGRPIDVGPTVLTMRWVFDRLFEDAGASVSDWVKLVRTERLARHAWGDGSRLDLYSDVDRSADAIGRFAGPREAEGYRRFAKRAEAIYETLRDSFIAGSRVGPIELSARIGLNHLGRISPFTPMWRALHNHFSDPRLRQLFGRYATYCGSSPFLAPATLMLVAHVEREGVWLVEGGKAELAKALRQLAEARGAEFRFDRKVVRILVDGGRAVGVETEDGEQVAADAVVWNGDVGALADGSLGQEARRAVSATASELSLSAMTWAMFAPIRGFPLVRHNVFFSRDSRAEFDDLFARARLPVGPTVYVCAQDRGDSDDEEPCKPERVFCLVNAPARPAINPLTAAEVDICESAAFELLKRCGLTIEWDRMATVRMTPQDFARAYPSTQGALYGPATHGWKATFAREGATTRLPGLYLAGGSVHPGPGMPMAALSGRQAALRADEGPQFDRPVEAGGYAWWYVDALSEDRQYGLTVIAFVGSVFSPYYAWAGRHDPLDHCAVNVALYGPRGTLWAMTERRRGAVLVSRDALGIGPSHAIWSGDALALEIDERAAPVPRRIRGRIRVRAEALNSRRFVLEEAGGHWWRPILPSAVVEVDMNAPAIGWRGRGYFDQNAGAEPLERGFRRWTWSRAVTDRETTILYDAERRRGPPLSLALRFDARGEFESRPSPLVTTLPRTRWGLARATRADDGRASALRSFEDTPFYARGLVGHTLFGERVELVHESLSLDRFANPVVRLMLPFRMPRR